VILNLKKNQGKNQLSLRWKPFKLSEYQIPLYCLFFSVFSIALIIASKIIPHFEKKESVMGLKSSGKIYHPAFLKKFGCLS